MVKYKNKGFDFLQNLEIPQAKTFVKSYSTIDTSNGGVYIDEITMCNEGFLADCKLSI